MSFAVEIMKGLESDCLLSLFDPVNVQALNTRAFMIAGLNTPRRGEPYLQETYIRCMRTTYRMKVSWPRQLRLIPF
jgi:hypothetical protein